VKDENNKPTNQVAQVSLETLTKLTSREEAVRQSGLIDIFEQHLPVIPKDYVFKNNTAFDLTGGVPRLVKYGHENYAEFIKLWAKMLPEAQKHEQGPAVVQVFHNVPPSALDVGDIVDMDDLDDE
jgi:hypothetical protein